MINKIIAKTDGIAYCKSDFYTTCDILHSSQYEFVNGINELVGEIDSGIWGISYILSMYKNKPKDFTLYNTPEIIVDDMLVSIGDFVKCSCYMDQSYHLFSTKQSVRKMVESGIRKTKINFLPEDIRNLFLISQDRFERPISNTGHECFKAMAAISYCYGKQVFCFPWMSKIRFSSYHRNITDLLEILERLNIVAILPLGDS